MNNVIALALQCNYISEGSGLHISGVWSQVSSAVQFLTINESMGGCWHFDLS